MDAVSLEYLQNVPTPAISRPADIVALNVGRVRLQSIKEAALGVGARGGYNERSGIINKALDLAARDEDTQYNFGALLIMGRIIPPVILEEREIYTDGGGTTLKLAGINYKVYSQARFTSRAQSWRQYLYFPAAEKLVMPNPILLPQNDDERKIWRDAVAQGWDEGVHQAETNFRINQSRLNRDYVGEVRYHILAERGMLTLPVVTRQDLPLITDGDKSMTLDETLLRIQVLPKFNGNMKEWTPLGNEIDAAKRGAADQGGGK